MKKLFFIIYLLTLIFLPSGINAVDFIIKAGIDFDGEHKIYANPNNIFSETKTGFSFSSELYLDLNNYIAFGAGAEYQAPRGLKSIDGEFNFVPVYGIIKFQLKAKKYKPFINLKSGYNFLITDNDYNGGEDLDGGFYYAFGTGVDINSIIIELLYSTNYGEFTGTPDKGDIKNTKLSISVGYNFNLWKQAEILKNYYYTFFLSFL